jgi:hypothetical protein
MYFKSNKTLIMKTLIAIGNLILLFNQSMVGQKIEQIQTQVENLTKVKATLEKKVSALQDSIASTTLKIDSLNRLIPLIQKQSYENEIRKLITKEISVRLIQSTSLLEKPDKNSKIIEGLSLNAKVKVIGLESYPYYKVKYKSKVGYVHSLSLELPKEIEDIEAKLMSLTTEGSLQNSSSNSPAPYNSYSPSGNNKTQYTPSKTSTNSKSGCSTVQCSGYTKKGNRCQNRTTNCSGRCHLH